MDANMPLIQYMRHWLIAFKQDVVKPSTYMRLETSVNALETYEIAQQPIGAITAFDVQNYIHELTSNGYALTTIRKQLLIVTAPLRQAAAIRLIPSNPCVCTRLPREDRVQKQKRSTDPYTKIEQQKFWQHLRIATATSAQLALALMLETGLRVGELLALRWEKVSFATSRMMINATILNPSFTRSASYQPSPKTKSSKRTVPLSDRAKAILARLNENRSPENPWVFTNRQGERLSYKSLVRSAKNFCKRIGIPYRGAHVFRHTFATNCYYKGMDVKLLSHLLGHASIGITYNTYVTLRSELSSDALRIMNQPLPQ